MKKIILFHPGTRHLLFLILMVMCLPISPQSPSAKTLFVDATNGTDIGCRRDCLPDYYITWATAAQSITEALVEAASTRCPGRDTIVVRGDLSDGYPSFAPEDDVNVTAGWWTGDPASYQTCDDNPTYVVNLSGTFDFKNDLPNGAIIQCFNISGGSPAMYMSASSATAIDHNTIFRKNKVGPSSGKPCIKWEGGSPIIEDNEFTGCVRPAIRFIGDAGTSTLPAIIRNNDFHGNSTTGSSGTYNTEIYFENQAPSQWVLIQDNLIHNDAARAGINFEEGDHNVYITGNQIYLNPFAGIHVSTAQSGQITISGEQNFTFAGGTQADYGNGSPNIIRDNLRGGIVLAHDATMDIISNDIYDNQWGGISTDQIDPDAGYPNYTGYSGTLGGAVLNIRKNYIHGNGKALNTIGGGINVRAATATIKNNVIYKNNRAGIRVGNFVQEISNNTIVANGSASAGMGGGIAYDSQINTCLDCMPSGTKSSPIPVKNNIIAYNVKAALMGMGFTNTPGSEERDYNLIYSNNPGAFWWVADCNYPLYEGDPSLPSLVDFKCPRGQYGFGVIGMNTSTWTKYLIDPNDWMEDPLFMSMTAGTEDYQLDTGSPGINAGSDNTDMGAWGGIGTFTTPHGTYNVYMDWLHGLPH